MARLRIRVELNRGGVGVPLHKLASVVHESERFFTMLAEDVHIQKERGEWLAFDFDHESLNFTAEFVGPVTGDQVSAFANAFGGSTSLRRATIAQFTRIADAIGEDELIGFGLYHADQELEPGEWRCLSRRDALRIADEIQLLMGAVGENGADTHLPAVADPSVGERLFRDRRDRAAAAQSNLPSLVREVEANLTKRISGIEGEVQSNTRMIQDLRQNTAATEESFRSLLAAVDTFCGQATRQLERLSVPMQLPEPPRPAPQSANSRTIIAAAIVVGGILTAGYALWPSKTSDSSPAKSPATVRAASSLESSKPASAEPVKPIAVEPAASKPSPVSAPVPKPGAMALHLAASEPAWVSIIDDRGTKLFAKVLLADETHDLELTRSATLRTGNAGGLSVEFNGQTVGQLGAPGKVREILFKDGAYKMLGAPAR
jgi:hypothetical protein